MAIEFGSPNLPAMRDGKNGTILSADYFNPIFARLDGRLHVVEQLRASWLEAVDTVTRQGLTRIDVVLAPAFEKLGQVLELGFLVVSSSTPATLSEGANITFVTDAGVQSELFTPSPMLSVQKRGSVDDWAVVKLMAPYNRVTRELQVQVVATSGDGLEHDDWDIGALAGSTAAQLAMLDRVETARAEVAANRAAVTADKQTVATDKAAVTALRGEALTYRNAAETFRDQAAASAAAAALFDPASFYSKSETYTRSQVETLIANAVNALIGGAPGALDTLNELAAAFGDDPNFATTVLNSLATKAPIAATQVSTNVTLVPGQRAWVMTDAAARTATLPSNPTTGAEVQVARVGANLVTINRNGKTIAGLSENLVIDEDLRIVSLTYVGNTWRVTAGSIA
ncbi:hypothetical protein GCM10007989_24350 [Devosia pacifica]|uniref:Uncharacterized protein n=1 Tax=Devosia pacifica TaxID=1335967 RepID=A0A918VVB2_9HYPH|nr:hypothetical protein [Devosia pacifica]GHA27613.1 hypothetical protein GCM10007989_24350 [Devosia pacifica]